MSAYILRERRELSRYQFLGESYVHGVMNGEGFAGDPDIQIFDILSDKSHDLHLDYHLHLEHPAFPECSEE